MHINIYGGFMLRLRWQVLRCETLGTQHLAAGQVYMNMIRTASIVSQDVPISKMDSIKVYYLYIAFAFA